MDFSLRYQLNTSFSVSVEEMAVAKTLMVATPDAQVEKDILGFDNAPYLFLEMFQAKHPFLYDAQKLPNWNILDQKNTSLRGALRLDPVAASVLFCARESTWFDVDSMDQRYEDTELCEALECLYTFRALLSDEAADMVQRGLQKIPLVWLSKGDRLDMLEELPSAYVPYALSRMFYKNGSVHPDLERQYPGIKENVGVWNLLSPEGDGQRRRFLKAQLQKFLHAHTNPHAGAPLDLADFHI